MKKKSTKKTTFKMLQQIKTRYGTYERFVSSDGKHQFYHLKARNGEILYASETVSRKASCETNLTAVAKLSNLIAARLSK